MGPFSPFYETSSALVKTGPGALHEVCLTPGNAPATATIYDGTSTGGTVIGSLAAAANGTGQDRIPDVVFSVGLYVAVSGNGAAVSGAFA